MDKEFVIHIFDMKQLKNTWVSPGIESAMGMSVDSFLNLPAEEFAKLYHPDETEKRMQFFSFMTQAPDGVVFEHEYRIWHKIRGEWVWFHSKSFPLRRDLNGVITEVLGISSEIKDPKIELTNSIYEKSINQYKNFTDEIHDGFIIVENGLIKYANSSFFKLLKLDSSDILGKTITTFIVNELSDFDINPKIDSSRKYESQIFLDSGESIDVEIFEKWISEGFGKLLKMFIIKDLRVQKQQEHQRLLEYKMNSLKTLSEGISNDLNNLLTIISGNLSTLEFENISEQAIIFLKRAIDTTFKARDLISLFSQFAKGKSIFPSILKLDSFIKESVYFILAGSNIIPRFHFPNYFYEIEIDREHLFDILKNIIQNSNDAMPNGGFIDVFINFIDQEMEILIRDYGIGIAKENLPYLFTPYFTTKKTNGDMGLGLGLSITHSLIQRNGGKIEINSIINKGTDCYLYFPLSQRRIEKSKKLVNNSFEPLPKMNKRRVLVLDGDTKSTITSVKVLEILGYFVESANSLKEAFEKISLGYKEGNIFNLIITDSKIEQDGDGIEFLTFVKNEFDNKIPIILSTNSYTSHYFSNYKDYGFSDVLLKPFNLKELNELFTKLFYPNLSKQNSELH
ncbi:PAS domain-containing protein [bacterium]|nr:PAS domain-containing protein [bacterium]